MSHKILLIDDDPLVLQTFQRLLEKEGYEVLTASNDEEALAAIHSKDFALVLSDIRMPGKDGVTTVDEIQESLKAAGKKDLPIIFITGYAEYGRERHAEFLGETLYKPVDTQKLLQTIREYL
jgi:CheY-like chemotaxis protein